MYDWFNKVFGRATNNYVGICRLLIHKSSVALILLIGIVVVAVLLGRHIPGSFLPEEDQGFLSRACNCLTPLLCNEPMR
ncbi:MAG: efflux RND transporter permease subunit [Limisphaerales bacterium]